MKMEMKISNEATNINDLDQLDDKLCFQIPMFYREFLLSQNGGLPKKGLFKYDNNNSSGVIFFGVNTGEFHSDLLTNFNIYKSRIPSAFLPIGHDPGGNLICMVAYGERQGRIYFWDHEEETEPPDYSNTYLISESFDHFLKSLEIDEDDEDW